jgi:hypothetical protein
MSSKRQSRVMQGEKTNIGDVDLGSLLSIRSRDKNPANFSLPALSQRSPVLAPASSSRVKVESIMLKTSASCTPERRLSTSQTPLRGKNPPFSESQESPSARIERSNQVEKLRKEFIERNTLHFTKLREAFRTIDKDHNGDYFLSFLYFRTLLIFIFTLLT